MSNRPFVKRISAVSLVVGVLAIAVIILIAVLGALSYQYASEISSTRTSTTTVTGTPTVESTTQTVVTFTPIQGTVTSTVTTTLTSSIYQTSTSTSVTPSTQILSSLNQSHAFQFVDASTINETGGLVGINATFRNNMATSQDILIVGVAYTASIANESVLGGAICCPVARGYFTNNSSTATAGLSANADSQFSANLAFDSLKDGAYLVELYVASLDGTVQSPVSSMFLEVSSSGGASCGGQEGASSTFVDPDNGMIYVANSGIDSVSVINSSTGRVVATISLPDLIGSFGFYTYDHDNGVLYVGSEESNLIFAINTTTNFLVSQPNLSTGSILLDPSNGEIFQFSNDLISVTNGTTDRIIANITGIQWLSYDWLSYDPVNEEIYVQASNYSIFAISGNDDRIAAEIQMPTSGYSDPLFDQDNGLFYAIANGSVLVINSSTNKLLPTTIPLPSSTGMGYTPVLYDPSNNEIYLYGAEQFENSSGNPDILIAIDGANNSVVATIPVAGLFAGLVDESPSFFYDSSNGDLYATSDLNLQNGTTGLLQISQTNKIIAQTVLPQWPFGQEVGGLTFDSINNMVYGTTGGTTVSVFSINNPATLVSTIQLGNCPVGYLLP